MASTMIRYLRWLVASSVIHHILCGPIVKLPAGDAEGVSVGSVGVWRGIPHAAPPVGDLRWRPPQPAKSWKPDVLDATEFKSECVQAASCGLTSNMSQLPDTSEDCLYMNVYAPLPLGSPSKAVFLWFHGGGFQCSTYTGGKLAHLDGTWNVVHSNNELIVATFNYRVNVFGFAASDRLRSRDPEGGTGNYGILDQRSAMRWINKNIDAFGGDASRVFIVGESAGADSVANHLVRQASWGLFRAAGIESGAFYTTGGLPGLKTPGHLPDGITPGNVTVADQESRFKALLARANCADVECLLRLSEGELLKIQNDPIGMHWAWVPAIDGVELKKPAALLAASGDLASVPILVGGNMEDSGVGLALFATCKPSDCDERDLFNAAKALLSNDTAAQELVRLYRNVSPRPQSPNISKWVWAAIHADADAEMNCPARRLARWTTQQGNHAFWYHFAYPRLDANGTLKNAQYPAYHSSEIDFVFHTLIQPSEEHFSSKVASYWRRFAISLDPSEPGLQQWPRYDDASGSGLVFGTNMSIFAKDHLLEHKCNFWDLFFHEQWRPVPDRDTLVLV